MNNAINNNAITFKELFSTYNALVTYVFELDTTLDIEILHNIKEFVNNFATILDDALIEGNLEDVQVSGIKEIFEDYHVCMALIFTIIAHTKSEVFNLDIKRISKLLLKIRNFIKQ